MESKERTLGSRASIFKRTDRVIPELEQQAEKVNSPANKAVKQRIKATFYINPEDVLAIDEIQSNEFRRTGKKPERSDIVSRAIQTYKEQQDKLATKE